MRIAILPAATLAVLSLTAAAWGQATTVQLPTYSFFTVQTSVSVPDGGGAYLGGINRARDSSTTRGFGPLANRGIGMDRGASGMSVHATIIDHKEMDERLLAEAVAKRGPVDATAAKVESLSRHMGRGEVEVAVAADHGTSPPIESVTAIRAKNAAAADTRSSESASYFAKAQQAEAEGKPSVAKIYYQMVMRRDTGELMQLAQGRLAALAGKQAAVAAR